MPAPLLVQPELCLRVSPHELCVEGGAGQEGEAPPTQHPLTAPHHYHTPDTSTTASSSVYKLRSISQIELLIHQKVLIIMWLTGCDALENWTECILFNYWVMSMAKPLLDVYSTSMFG